MTLVARFGTRVTVNSVGAGHVALEPQSEWYRYGTRVHVTPRPEAGNYLGLWDAQWSGQSKIGWVLTVTNASPSITGFFVPLEAGRNALMVETVGGGVVDATPARMGFDPSESVRLEALPWAGWTFSGWSGDAAGTENPLFLAMSADRRMTATFSELSPGPSLAPIGDRTVDELSLLEIPLQPGHSTDVLETVGLVLSEGPPGMYLTAERVLYWRPEESQGPGAYPVRVRVFDGDGRSAEQSFEVTVLEVNSAPVLGPVPDAFVPHGGLLSVQLQASDSDLPAQELALDVVVGPAGLTVSPTGVIEWNPSGGTGQPTNEVVVRVTDNGAPPLASTTAFKVVVLSEGFAPVFDGWTLLADATRFELVEGAFTWEQAKTDAEARGGHLATFASAAEWEAGKSVWQAYGRSAWIGGYQLAEGPEPRGGWVWITGEPWSFEAWAPSEPNNYLGFVENHLDILAAGGWNDAPGATRQPYLIEYPERGPVAPFDRFELNEGATMGISIRASDPDLPQQMLSLELVSGPEGMVLTPAQALIWTPTEAQGPSTNEVVLRVTDDGEPPASATVSFEVVVREVNRAPAVASRLVMDFGADPAGVATVAGTNNAAWVVTGGNPGGFLGLTYSRTNEYTALVLPPVPHADAVIAGFRMSCDVRAGNGPEERVADGFSFSFAREGDPVLVDPWDQTGYAGGCCAETGTRTGLAVSFDTWAGNTYPGADGDTDDVEGLIVRVDNVTVVKVAIPTRNGEPADATSLQTGPRDAAYWAGGGNPLWPAAWATLSWQPLVLELNPEGRFSAWWKGVPVLEDVETGFVPGPGRFVLAGRTANSVGNVHLDNLRLSVITRHEVAEGETLTLALDANDPDLPPPVLDFEVLRGPAGASVNAEGVLTWTPAEAQGPSTNVVEVRVRDDGVPPVTVIAAYQIVVKEVNQPPVWSAMPDLAVDEETPLEWNLEADDPDLPPQALTFRLVSGPDGLLVSSEGALLWTPGEADGPSEVSVTVAVDDDGGPPLSATNTFRITVREVNRPPLLDPVDDFAMDEGSPLILVLGASDPDLPRQALTFSLAAGPAGLTVSPGGILTWTPGEADGPSEVVVDVAVTDDGTPPLTTVGRFRITVREVNQPPVMAPVPAIEVDEGALVSLTLTAGDPDVPPQALVFSLVSGPEGMTATPSGELRWQTGEADGPGTVIAEVRVTDDGDPPQSADQRIVITVREVNEPPVLDPVPDQVAAAGEPFEWLLTGRDADLPPQPLTFALVSGPTGLTVEREGLLRWTPPLVAAPSTNEVTVLLLDGALSVRGTFRIVVPEWIVLGIQAPRADGRIVLEIRAGLLKPVVVEEATVLGAWEELQRLLGLGMDTPVELLINAAPGPEARYWRVRGD